MCSLFISESTRLQIYHTTLIESCSVYTCSLYYTFITSCTTYTEPKIKLVLFAVYMNTRNKECGTVPSRLTKSNGVTHITQTSNDVPGFLTAFYLFLDLREQPTTWKFQLGHDWQEILVVAQRWQLRRVEHRVERAHRRADNRVRAVPMQSHHQNPVV